MIPLRARNASYTTPWVSWSFILLCAIVFAYQVTLSPAAQLAVMKGFAFVPSHLTAMADTGPDARALGTLLTSLFLHGGVLHVASNVWFLKVFGDDVEDRLGHVRFAGFFALCGVAAALTQWAIEPSSRVPVVGASGAIAGVLAAYLALFPRAEVTTFVLYRVVELPAWLLIGLWFALQFYAGVTSLGAEPGGGVAHWAHVGGFVAGLAAALALRARERAKAACDAREGDAELGTHRA